MSSAPQTENGEPNYLQQSKINTRPNKMFSHIIALLLTSNKHNKTQYTQDTK